MRAAGFAILLGLATLGWAAESPLYKVGNRELGWRGASGPKEPQDFLDKIQPILAKRCVACHGCYEAPCQLNLETYEGLRRGFLAERVYGTRVDDEKKKLIFAELKPTRLIDEKDLPAWRKRGFHPVIAHDSEAKDSAASEFESSLVYLMLQHSAKHNEPGFSLKGLNELATEVRDVDKLQCVATETQFKNSFSAKGKNPYDVIPFNKYAEKSDHAGMPFALPRLSKAESDGFNKWMKEGALAPGDDARAALTAPRAPETIKKWEEFFNRASAQAQITARYIYEHVFSAHLAFEESPGEFYQLVRARSDKGAIEEIVKPLPYDPPGVGRVYYRLKKVIGAISQKTHIVWPLNDKKLERLEKQFGTDWKREKLEVPGYAAKGINPFETFSAIPGVVRARFMIENAKVIIGAMVQGSVCIGSRATYAIRDNFWVWFLKPESDVSALDPKLGLTSWDTLATAPIAWRPETPAGDLLLKEAEKLDLATERLARRVVSTMSRLKELSPLHVTDKWIDAWEDSATELVMSLRKHGASVAETLGVVHHFMRTTRANQDYQTAWERSLRAWLASKGRTGLADTDIWTGDGDPTYPKGNNPNAWLRVLRHGLSATVHFLASGSWPQSIWVLSYSNFERLYYNLVASFKPWGSIPHKLATWRHMSYVRLEGEDLAISLLRLKDRERIRERFTRGFGAVKNFVFFPLQANEEIAEGPSGLLRRPKILPARGAETAGIDGKTPDESVRLLVAKITARLSGVKSGQQDVRVTAEQKDWEKPLLALQNLDEAEDKKTFAQQFPEILYLKVKTKKGATWYYSINADRAYKAHNIIFLEEPSRDPARDTISVYRGFVGAYPAAFLEIDEDGLAALVADIQKLKADGDWTKLLADYAVGRNAKRFWDVFDEAHAWKAVRGPGNDPLEQGIADLGQYGVFTGKE